MPTDRLSTIIGEDIQYNLSDFALFYAVIKNKKAFRNVLSIILDESDVQLIDVKAESVILNKSGKRAIRLDAWALTQDNRQVSMEMQQDSKSDSIPKRSRYYQSMLDTPTLKSGKHTRYKDLLSTIIIFITQEDIFKKNLTKYTFTEQCEEVKGLHLEDGTTKIFVNMSSKNGCDELVSLLQYMKNTTLDNPEIVVKDKRIVELDEIVTEVRQSEEWEEVSMNILEYGEQRGIEKGIEKGRAEGIRALIQDNLDDGKTEKVIISKLIKLFGLSEADAKTHFQNVTSLK